MPTRRRAVRGVVLALLAVVLTGCRLAASAEIAVDRDGSGTVGLTVAVDRALLDELDALGIDPTADLAAAVAAEDPAEGWTVDRRATDDGGLAVTVAREAATPDDLTATLRDLSAGLSPDDPAIVADLDLDVADDGAATLAGTAELRAPAGPGVLGDPEAIDAGALADLVDEAVTAELVVALPGEAAEHDADEVDGGRLTWRLEVGETRTVTARAAAPTGPDRATIVGVVGGATLLAAVVAVAALLSRRRRRATSGDPAP